MVTMDPMSLYFPATMTPVWARRGQTPILRVATQPDQVHFYGALQVRSAHERALTLPKPSGDMTGHFRDPLQAGYPARPLLMLGDRAQGHKGQAVRAYLAQPPQIQTRHFPPGCPQLNPQEPVWERTGEAGSHQHTRTDFSALVQAFRHHLDNPCFKFNWIEKYAPPVLLAN